MTYKSLSVFVILAMLLPLRGHAQYHLSNAGFESWEGTSSTACPSHWSSFPQADGSWAWAANTPQHYHRHGGRPGTSGTSYLTIFSRSVMGVVANGNITTGQIHAGGMSASSSSNYNYTHRGSTYCHPFSGTPDSMYVWVSYYAASGSSEGSVRAYLHGDSDFRDPNDCSDPTLYRGKAVARFTPTTTSATMPSWVQQRVPFTYDGTSSVNYVLMSMTTNATAGGGSANDSLSVDDIEFVYSAWLDGILINGSPIASFQRDVFDYADSVADTAALLHAAISCIPQAADAIVTINDYRVDDFTRRFVLDVLAEDSLTRRTYSVTLACPEPSGDTTGPLTIPSVQSNADMAMRLYPNPVSDKMTVEVSSQNLYSEPARLFVIDAAGRTVLSMSSACSATQTIDVHALPTGVYTLLLHSSRGDVAQRFSIVR